MILLLLTTVITVTITLMIITIVKGKKLIKTKNTDDYEEK